MSKIAKKKSTRKNYRSVQFPENIIKEIKLLIDKYPLYRNHHEFLIDAGRRKIAKFVDTIHKRNQLMIQEVSRKEPTN